MKKKRLCWLKLLIFLFILSTVLSVHADVLTLGDMANEITKSFANLARLITAGSYIAGFGFVMSSVMKFKAHKDNPTQIPIGTPIALLFVGSALIFIPDVFSSVGHSLFGDNLVSGGVTGITFIAG